MRGEDRLSESKTEQQQETAPYKARTVFFFFSYLAPVLKLKLLLAYFLKFGDVHCVSAIFGQLFFNFSAPCW